MSGTVLRILQIVTSYQHCKTGDIIPILWVRKLSHRDHRSGKSGAGILHPLFIKDKIIGLCFLRVSAIS